MHSGASSAFPVPTPQNPSAVFTKEHTLDLSSPASSFSSLLTSLALGRNDNKAKSSEDYRRRVTDSRRFRQALVGRDREDKSEYASLLGIPKENVNVLDVCSWVETERRKETRERVEESAMAYERAVKRVVLEGEGEDSTERLQRDLLDRQEKNRRAKRAAEARTGGDGMFVNKANAQFNAGLEKTMAKDARTQRIKQNLERGTAL